MRIADLSNGGVACYCRELGRRLPELDPDNRYIKLRIQGAEPDDGDGETVRTPIRNESPDERKSLSELILRLKPDLLHSAWFVPVPGPYRRILTVYDTLFDSTYPEFQTPGALRRRNLLRDEIPRLDGVVCISQFTRRSVLRTYPVSGGKLHVTHLAGQPLRKAPEDRWNSVEGFGIGRPFIVFLGHSVGVSYKNFQGTIKAFPRIRDAGVRMVVTGSPESLSDEAAREAAPFIQEGTLIFTGYLQARDLGAVLAEAELLIYPSFEEGFGLPLLEAMSLGVPIAAARAGALPEVAGEAAAWFDPSDPENMAHAVLQVLNSRELRHNLIRAGKERLKRYDWNTTAFQTLAVYRVVERT